jgi:hypothetical protein
MPGTLEGRRHLHSKIVAHEVNLARAAAPATRRTAATFHRELLQLDATTEVGSRVSCLQTSDPASPAVDHVAITAAIIESQQLDASIR